MDDDFYNWLDKCPVLWFRLKDDTDTVEYTFHKPVKEEDSANLKEKIELALDPKTRGNF